jgi:hypothetical protein
VEISIVFQGLRSVMLNAKLQYLNNRADREGKRLTDTRRNEASSAHCQIEGWHKVSAQA